MNIEQKLITDEVIMQKINTVTGDKFLTLEFDRLDISPSIANHINKHMPRLWRLDLVSDENSVRSFDFLKFLDKLDSLKLDLKDLTNQDIVFLKDCRQLGYLNLAHNSDITSSGLSFLSDFKKLTDIDVSGTGVDTKLFNILPVAQMREIHAFRVDGIDDATFKLLHRRGFKGKLCLQGNMSGVENYGYDFTIIYSETSQDSEDEEYIF